MKNLISIMIIALLVGCGPTGGNSGSAENTEEAMEMLESVFEGPYSKWAIKQKMDTVLTLYNTELVKENYLKVGNQLVAKRKESDGAIREMDIIAHMINANSGREGVSFDEQLNISVRAIEAGSKQTGQSQHQ